MPKKPNTKKILNEIVPSGLTKQKSNSDSQSNGKLQLDVVPTEDKEPARPKTSKRKLLDLNEEETEKENIHPKRGRPKGSKNKKTKTNNS